MYQVSSYAPGGRIKRRKMIIAHFNPHELNALDHLQGKRETCPRTGMRSYAHLEEVLKNPHILRSLVHNVHEHAQGGAAHRSPGGRLHDYHDPRLNRMADAGIHGDTEVAFIGPHTKNVFDHLVKMTAHPLTVNPHDGHPHYGFLDSILGGLGKIMAPGLNLVRKIPGIGGFAGQVADGIGGAIKGGVGAIQDVADKALPALLPAAGQLAQQYLPQLAQKYGGDRMGQIANTGTQFLNQQLQSRYTPEQVQQGQQMAGQIGQLGQGVYDAGRSAYDAYQGGGGFKGAAGSALQNIGDRAGGQYGGLASQLGQGLQSGRGYGDMARDIGGGALQAVGQDMGGDFGNVANQFGQGLQQRQSPLNMARNVGGAGLQAMGGLGQRYGGATGGELGNYARQFGRGVSQGQGLGELAGTMGQIGRDAYGAYGKRQQRRAPAMPDNDDYQYGSELFQGGYN